MKAIRQPEAQATPTSPRRRHPAALGLPRPGPHPHDLHPRAVRRRRTAPKGSIYGNAKAITPLLDEPLEGPVYLRSSSHKLPDLVVALHGIVDIDLVGRIDSFKGGIRGSFETTPDAPVSKFVLTMQGGKKGLVVNSRNLCLGTNRADARFTGQNGKVHDFRPVVRATGCGGKRKK